MMLVALNHHTNTPTCADSEQKTFILAAIRGMQAMGILDKDFVIEMLVQFLDGDREVRYLDWEIVPVIITGEHLSALSSSSFLSSL
jgi:hypothetical protein